LNRMSKQLLLLWILSIQYGTSLTQFPYDKIRHSLPKEPSPDFTNDSSDNAKDSKDSIIIDKDPELVKGLEKAFLSSFGLSEKPKVNKSHLLLANTVRSFTHTESPEDKFHPEHKMVFHFDVSSIPARELLQGAELRINSSPLPSMPKMNEASDSETSSSEQVIRRKWSKKELNYLTRINVYDIVRPSRGSRDSIHKLIDTSIIDPRMNSTASLDVSPALKRWLSKPQTNYGLYVEVTPLKPGSTAIKGASHVRLRRSINQDDISWSDQEPLLIVRTDDTKLARREKRSPPSSSNRKPHCRKNNMYVDFKKLNWDSWIVAPSGFDAFLCNGDCPNPLAKHMNATNHAVYQSIIHSRYPNLVPAPCCVPITYSAISMMYLDSDKEVVLKTYEDMVVESCGCR
ncbi:Protein decapentaplegic, partial [Armadillidium nasatum]